MDFTTFKNHCLVNGFSQGSTQTFIAKVELFFKTYTELNQENLNAFFASKIDIWNGSTFNLFINSLKHYAKFLKVELEFPKYHRVNSKIKDYIDEKELDEILKYVPMIFENNWLKIQTMLNILFYTGIRPKEIKNLKRADINIEEKYLIIRDTKVKRDKIVVLSNKICQALPVVFAQEPEKINAFNLTDCGLM